MTRSDASCVLDPAPRERSGQVRVPPARPPCRWIRASRWTTTCAEAVRPRRPAAGPLLLATVLAVSTSPASAQAPGATPEWRVVADVPLPGKAARFDYQSFDSAAGRLWIAHMGAGEVLAFDVRTRRVVARVRGMPGATGVRVVPSLGRVFASLSAAHAVAVLDSRDGRVLARVSGGRFPDGLAYAPEAKRLFVSDESGRQELVIDVPSSTARRPIAMGGEAGNTQYDPGAGRVWVAVQTRDELVAVDPRTDAVVERVPVPGIRGPHGFYLDSEHRLAYVTGEAGGTVGVLNLRTKKILHTYRVGDEPDVLAMDPARHRLFVASESGVLTALEARGDSLLPLAGYRAPHAHSVAVDPATHLVYVPLENVGGRPVLRILDLAP
jgi:DNA-binding beta-propeller fold protein YncE